MFDMSAEEHWYALKVFYNRVFDVERLLAQDGVKTYIPLRSTETPVGGRTIRRREPAVSSLMFVRQAERAVLELMQRAKATSPLMVYFDRETKKPAVIPDPEMEAFMLVTSTDDPGLEYLPEAPAELRRGDRVRVTEGVFKGAEGYIRRDKGRRRLIVSVEGFYKKYGNIPLSVSDGIPLSCKGDDYGVVGNEALRPTAVGRSYGIEAMARWQIPGRVNLVGSVSMFLSEYRADAASEYIVSAWDSRFVANLSGTYDLPRNWSVGARLSAVGGTPYTPYDVEKSSLVEAWDAQGRPYYDYGRYNDGRLDAFAQVDLRIDKTFYFRRCMLGLYIDLQNVTGSKLRRPDVLMSTGVVENPQAPAAEQRYRMKYIGQQSGSLIPTLGITVEF